MAMLGVRWVGGGRWDAGVERSVVQQVGGAQKCVCELHG